MTMATVLLPRYRAVEVVIEHMLEKRRTALLVIGQGKGDDHGHLPPFLSRDL